MRRADVWMLIALAVSVPPSLAGQAAGPAPQAKDAPDLNVYQIDPITVDIFDNWKPVGRTKVHLLYWGAFEPGRPMIELWIEPGKAGQTVHGVQRRGREHDVRADDRETIPTEHEEQNHRGRRSDQDEREQAAIGETPREIQSRDREADDQAERDRDQPKVRLELAKHAVVHDVHDLGVAVKQQSLLEGQACPFGRVFGDVPESTVKPEARYLGRPQRSA